jgi:Ca2+-binding EF-hand superfamily protein
MAQIDTDGDGVITFEEFSAFWKRVLDNHVSEVKQEGRK